MLQRVCQKNYIADIQIFILLARLDFRLQKSLLGLPKNDFKFNQIGHYPICQ